MNKFQKQQLKSLWGDERFQTVLELIHELLDKWRKENVIGRTSYETLRLTFWREAKIAGLQEFYDRLERDPEE